MTEHTWRLPERGPGRLYQNSEELTIKYDDSEELIARIVTDLNSFIQIENCVRLLLDGKDVHPACTNITVPFEGEKDRIIQNLAQLIYQQLWGYYLSADPKATHHGLTNLVYEGNQTSLIRRETEKFLSMVNVRHDIAGRVMRDFHMASEVPPFERDVYMRDVCSKSLDITLGVRIYTYGEAVNRVTTFIPIGGGENAISRIYYNLEHIIHQNLVAYDELHDHYLPVSEELIGRELEATIIRARNKGNTRKKIINGLKFHTVLMDDPRKIKHASLADMYYDKLNRIDLLEEAAQRSRDLLATALIRSSELTADAGVKIDKLKLEERVYIERPVARETVAAAPPKRGRQAAKPAAAAARPPAGDGLTEL
ncbi:MAG: hypothetical protein HY342_06940 [Candidatus Lambdaproteobacteria bacterium]|nr:hypothetical protein [Candidatus Lambdaproteobacteria bacterium]